MNFREIANIDLKSITSDSKYGFGIDINITDPDGLSKDIVGYTNDINFMIDPDTGQAVSGRNATILLHIQILIEAGFSSLPAAQSDTSKKPWIVKFNDLQNNQWTFSVKETNPDRTSNVILCNLEFYKE